MAGGRIVGMVIEQPRRRYPTVTASAKMRTGDPNNDPADLASEVGAGAVPLRITDGASVPAPDLRATLEVPSSVHAPTNSFFRT